MEFTVYDINSSNEGGKLGQSQAYSKLIGHIYLDVSSSFCSFSKRLIKNGNGSTLTK